MAKKKKKTQRRRSGGGGLLTGMRYAASKKPKKRSLPRRLLAWIGGGLALAVVAVALVVLVWRMLSPEAGIREREAEFAVTAITSIVEPREEAPDAIAEGTILVEGERLGLLLDADQLAAVQAGAPVKVRYTYFPFRRATARLRVDDWSVVDGSSGD